jgi:TonB family protein
VKKLVPAFFVLILSCALFAQSDIQVLKQVAPERYPPAAMAVRAHGDVMVSVDLNADGKVVEAKALVGHPLLREIAQLAAKQWEFSTSKDIRTRNVNLTFSFEIGGSRRIESSEKAEDIVLTTTFPSPFWVESIREILIPRLLLLPRENSVVKPAFCELHQQEMTIETQRANCYDGTGYVVSDLKTENLDFAGKYQEAAERFFPNAHAESFSRCGETTIDEFEIQYCPICRARRGEWLHDN